IEFRARSGFVDDGSADAALSILAAVATSERSPVIALRSVGGAVSRVAGDATAYAHREATVMFVTLLAGPTPVVDAAAPALDRIWSDLAPHTSGAYANFLSSATDDDVAAVYPEATYERLAAVKQTYDPRNVFARNHNVRPR